MQILKTIILLIAFALSARAATPEEATEQFFQRFSKGAAVEAVDAFFGDNPFMLRKKDDLDAIKRKLSSFTEEQYGKLISWKRLTSESISDVLSERVYIVIYERTAVRFRFMFYKPKSDWIGHGFSFDSDLDDELERKSDRKLLSAE
jgi:hypothetical protein